MKRFLCDDRGYALALTLLFMPVFVGLSLVIIDLGRGNNAHSDLYAAADAVALAAAGELDGGPDAIDRAKAAMTEVRNSVSFLSLEDGEFEITLAYVDEEGNEFNVIFLTDIPENDEDPIDQDWVNAYGTTSGTEANYVYVAAQSVDLDTIFPLPVSFTDQDVPVQAIAVAGRRSAACGITPLFICNPFEDELGGSTSLQQAFSEGKMHGRLMKLHPGGPTTAGPGNFGFLQIPGKNDNSTASANAIREFFASGYSPVCYDASEVDLKPGAATSIKAGINTRFDIWDGPFGGNGPRNYAPAENVRKGYKRTDPDNPCSQVLATDEADAGKYMAFPPNVLMDDPGETGLGAFLGEGNWPIDEYFSINHNIDIDAEGTGVDLDAMNSLNNFPNYDPSDPSNVAATIPSRYDVYRYEIANNMVGNSSNGGTGEDGLPMCSEETVNNLPPTSEPDRRVIQAAIINCEANSGQLNGAKSVPVEAFASVFMTNPMEGNNSGNVTNPDGGTIDLEVIDITGAGGLGTLDDYIRIEAVLVR